MLYSISLRRRSRTAATGNKPSEACLQETWKVEALSVKAKPPTKEATLEIIAEYASLNSKTIDFKLVEIVAPVAELTCDIKKEVKAAAIKCMAAICACTGNKDLDPFLDAVVEAACSIDKTHKCVERLAGCVFVQNVETPALAIMLPVLTRGLHDKVV